MLGSKCDSGRTSINNSKRGIEISVLRQMFCDRIDVIARSGSGAGMGNLESGVHFICLNGKINN